MGNTEPESVSTQVSQAGLRLGWRELHETVRVPLQRTFLPKSSHTLTADNALNGFWSLVSRDTSTVI